MTQTSFWLTVREIIRAASLSCVALVALPACSSSTAGPPPTDTPPGEAVTNPPPAGTYDGTGGTATAPPSPAQGQPTTGAPVAPPAGIVGGPTTPPGPSPEPGLGGAAPPPAPTPGPTDPSAPPPSPSGQIGGIEFLQRIAGRWTGINSNTPIGFDFPLTVDFAPSSESFLFGEFELDADNNVLWGFNIETYDGQDVLAYRNGGYLLGFRRDSRTKLVEYDTARGYYRFCAVKEHGLPVDGCNYIDARYTFTAPDRMLFEVTTRGGEPHVHWDAARVEAHALPSPFPASLASQGDGAALWPAAANMTR